jgi:hypothetical protein
MRLPPVAHTYPPIQAGSRVCDPDGRMGVVERLREMTEQTVLVAWESGSRRWTRPESLLVLENPK